MLRGDELDRMRDDELAAAVEEADVFARVVPEHKLRIVRALQGNGQVVAMTGDGVNDVPALQAAHIGVAMGQRGTDAASEAADMVLTDDDYSTLVAAIEGGRAVYQNIQRFTHFLLAANAGEVLLFALAIPIGFPAPLTVLQILLVNLLTDGAPAVALAVDPPDRDTMRRAPRRLSEGLLDPIWTRILVGGGLTGAAAFASFLIGDQAQGQELARTMAFVTVVAAQLFYVWTVRGDDWFFRAGGNPALHVAVAGSAVVLALVLSVPALADRIDVVSLGAGHLAAALGLALVPFAVSEVLKGVRRSAPRADATRR